MKKISYLLWMAVSLLVYACQGGGNGTISADEFEKKLKDSADAQLVDVRTPEEYLQGHLHNAVNYDIRSDDFISHINTLRKDKPVFVYCMSGGRSASAAKILTAQGFSKVYNLQGGILKWRSENKDVEEGAQSITEQGMSLSNFNQLIQTDKYVLVDYNAKWCAPCQHMKPMLAAFVEKRKATLNFVEIDADENKNLFKQKNIASIPVLELYKDGKIIWRHEGELDEAALVAGTKL